jgi:predicted nucleotide-binding protein
LIEVNLPKYHIYIEYEKDREKSGIRFNVPEEELVRTFVIPFNEGQPFWFKGRLLNPAKVQKALLFWSYEDGSKLVLPNREEIVSHKDPKFVMENICAGKVKNVQICTEKFLTSPKKNVDAPSSATISSSTNVNSKRKVFIVHGKDETMKKALVDALEMLWLEPIVLHQQPNRGEDLVEQFASYSAVSFAVILLSPDEYTCTKGETVDKRRFRSGQDVIFELGFFVGRLGEGNVLALFKESADFEVPLNHTGLLFAPFDEKASWKMRLLTALASSGFDVNTKMRL